MKRLDLRGKEREYDRDGERGGREREIEIG